MERGKNEEREKGMEWGEERGRENDEERVTREKDVMG